MRPERTYNVVADRLGLRITPTVIRYRALFLGFPRISDRACHGRIALQRSAEVVRVLLEVGDRYEVPNEAVSEVLP